MPTLASDFPPPAIHREGSQTGLMRCPFTGAAGTNIPFRLGGPTSLATLVTSATYAHPDRTPIFRRLDCPSRHLHAHARARWGDRGPRCVAEAPSIDGSLLRLLPGRQLVERAALDAGSADARGRGHGRSLSASAEYAPGLGSWRRLQSLASGVICPSAAGARRAHPARC